MASLGDLPDAVLVAILQRVDVLTLVRSVARTNRRLRALATSEVRQASRINGRSSMWGLHSAGAGCRRRRASQQSCIHCLFLTALHECGLKSCILKLPQALWLDRLPSALALALRGAPGSSASASATGLDLPSLYCSLYNANLLQVGSVVCRLPWTQMACAAASCLGRGAVGKLFATWGSSRSAPTQNSQCTIFPGFACIRTRGSVWTSSWLCGAVPPATVLGGPSLPGLLWVAGSPGSGGSLQWRGSRCPRSMERSRRTRRCQYRPSTPRCAVRRARLCLQVQSWCFVVAFKPPPSRHGTHDRLHLCCVPRTSILQGPCWRPAGTVASSWSGHAWPALMQEVDLVAQLQLRGLTPAAACAFLDSCPTLLLEVRPLLEAAAA